MFLETERLLRKFGEEDFADFCTFAMDGGRDRLIEAGVHVLTDRKMPGEVGVPGTAECAVLRRHTVSLRAYRPSDCAALAALFYETVHTVNARDYTEEQLDAWATGTVDLARWDRSFRAHTSVVALVDGDIAGFGDIDDTGYLDRLYVHKDRQGMGVATAICDALERAVRGKVTIHVSITARAFFERRGYCVVREQQVERGGVWLTNYVMEKEL